MITCKTSSLLLNFIYVYRILKTVSGKSSVFVFAYKSASSKSAKYGENLPIDTLSTSESLDKVQIFRLCRNWLFFERSIFIPKKIWYIEI